MFASVFHKEVWQALTCIKHLGGVPVVSIMKQSHIYVDNVTLLQRSVVWDSVAHALVHAGAHTLGELAIVQRRWVGIVVHDHLVHGPVNLICCYTRLDQCA